MAHFSWTLEHENRPAFKLFTAKDYSTYKNAQKPNPRRRKTEVRTATISEGLCDCRRSSSCSLQYVEGVPKILMPDLAIDHAAADGLLTPPYGSINNRAPETLLAATSPACPESKRKPPTSTVCDSSEDDIGWQPLSTTSIDTRDVPHTSDSDNACVHVAEEVSIFQKDLTLVPTGTAQSHGIHTAAGTETNTISRAWTQEMREQLVRLREESQLRWTKMEQYFPGQNKSSISQQYLRMQKPFASPPVVHIPQVPTNPSRTRPARSMRGSQRSSMESTTGGAGLATRKKQNMKHKRSICGTLDTDNIVHSKELPQSRSGRVRYSTARYL